MKNTVFTAIAMLLILATIQSEPYASVVTIKGLSIPDGRVTPRRGKNAFALYEQYDNTCGPTSVQMVLHYYGQGTHMGAIWDAGGIHTVAWGTYPSEVKQALNRLGVPAHRYDEDTQGYRDDPYGRLRSYVNRDRPPIILLRLGEKAYHWVVVVGYNSAANEYLLADPAHPRYKWVSRAWLAPRWRLSYQGSGNAEGAFFDYVGTAVSAKADPYTVVVPLNPPTRRHRLGNVRTKLRAFELEGKDTFLGTTRGWSRTLTFSHSITGYVASGIELVSSTGTATLDSHSMNAQQGEIYLRGRIEDGLTLRGRMWVIVWAYY